MIDHTIDEDSPTTMLDFDISMFIASVQGLTNSAHFIVWYERLGSVQFALGNVAVPASADGVRIIVRHILLLFARIEPEHSLCFLACGEFSESHRLIVVSRRGH